MAKILPAKKKKQKLTINPVVYIVAVVFIVLAGIYFFKSYKTFVPRSSTTSNATRTFHSSTLGFTIDVPSYFELLEQEPNVLLIKNNQKIIITRSATNFTTLKDHLNFLDEKNSLKTIKQEYIDINNYEVNKRNASLSSGNTQQVYIFFIDRWIYTMMTENLELITQLDQIAQTFRYAPD